MVVAIVLVVVDLTISVALVAPILIAVVSVFFVVAIAIVSAAYCFQHGSELTYTVACSRILATSPKRQK